jgi:hypothetical protein
MTDYLASGDKRDLLVLRSHGRAHIVAVRQLLAVLNPR